MGLLLLVAMVPPLATSAARRDHLASAIQHTKLTSHSIHHSSVHAWELPDNDNNPLALSGQSRNLLHFTVPFHLPWLYPRCPRCRFSRCSRSGLFKIGHCRRRVSESSPRWRTIHCFMWRWPWIIVPSATSQGNAITPPAPGAPPNDPPSMPADAVFDIPVAAATSGEDGTNSTESDSGPVRGAACFTDNDCALPEEAFANVNGTAPLATDGIVTAQCVRMGLEGALSDDQAGICMCLYPEDGEEGGGFLDVCIQVPVVAAIAVLDGPFDAAAGGPPPLRLCSVNATQTSDNETGVLLSSDYFASESVYEYEDIIPEDYGYEYVGGEFQQVIYTDDYVYEPPYYPYYPYEPYPDPFEYNFADVLETESESGQDPDPDPALDPETDPETDTETDPEIRSETDYAYGEDYSYMETEPELVNDYDDDYTYPDPTTDYVDDYTYIEPETQPLYDYSDDYTPIYDYYY
eukprot:jgi/Ulvmu1/10677/UM067_0001.1